MLRGTVGFSSSSSCSSSCSFSTTRTTVLGTFPRSLAAKSNSFLAAKKTRTAAFAAKKRSVLSSIRSETNNSSSFHSEKVVSTEEDKEKEETKGGRDWTEKMVKSENFEKGKARAFEAYSRNNESGESILTLKTDDELNLEEHVRPKWSRDRETENVPSTSQPLLSIAPMMEYTHNHFRYLCRLLSKRVWLWTEMEVDMTLKHVPVELRNKYVDFTLNQHPLVMQLGGSDADALGFSASLAKPHGYDEINLNCGCPSEKVAGKGCFGATLMRDPDLVAECCAAMAKNADGIPISVKCRIGVDGNDSYDELYRFVETIASKSPVRRFHVHCRKRC